MCLFFPRHPTLILSSKSIYLPCKVFIDRELECLEWCQLKMSLSKQSSHASPSSPHPEAKAACFCLSVEDSLSDGPSSHLLLLSWAIDFSERKCLWQRHEITRLRLKKLSISFSPKSNSMEPPREPLPYLPLQTLLQCTQCFAICLTLTLVLLG